MSTFSITHLRRPLRAAGVLLWASLAYASSQCVDIREARVTCTAATPSHTYNVNLEITNTKDCAIHWITLHPATDFHPSILPLANPIAPGNSTVLRSILQGPVPSDAYTFTLLAHCYEGGIVCQPCRQEVTVTLPNCDDPAPTPVPSVPIASVRPLGAPRAFRIERDTFVLQLPEAPTKDVSRFVVEGSEDMVKWEVIAVRSAPELPPSETPLTASAQTSAGSVWIPKGKEHPWRFFRVREALD